MTDLPDRRGRWVNLGARVDEIRDEAWDAYWAEMGADEALEFLRDPKRELVSEGLIDEDFRIETHLVNTDVASASDPTCKMLLIFPKEKLALITVYRHPPEG